jgi:hypothetical protein
MEIYAGILTMVFQLTICVLCFNAKTTRLRRQKERKFKKSNVRLSVEQFSVGH